MTTVINTETAIAATVEAVTKPVKAAKPKGRKAPKARKVVDAAPLAKTTIAWARADNVALVSQGKAVAAALAAFRALGHTHEEKNGEWRPTKAFLTFRTDYTMQVCKVLGDDEGKRRTQVITAFALRAMRINLTPDALEKTVGKVQTFLETKEDAWKKSGRTKTDHSLGGVPAKGGREKGSGATEYDKALAAVKARTLTGEEIGRAHV